MRLIKNPGNIGVEIGKYRAYIWWSRGSCFTGVGLSISSREDFDYYSIVFEWAIKKYRKLNL